MHGHYRNGVLVRFQALEIFVRFVGIRVFYPLRQERLGLLEVPSAGLLALVQQFRYVAVVRDDAFAVDSPQRPGGGVVPTQKLHQ